MNKKQIEIMSKNFPVLKEHQKQGSVIDRMTLMGLDGSEIHKMLSKYNLYQLGEFAFQKEGILNHCRRLQDLHIELNYTLPGRVKSWWETEVTDSIKQYFLSE